MAKSLQVDKLIGQAKKKREDAIERAKQEYHEEIAAIRKVAAMMESSPTLFLKKPEPDKAGGVNSPLITMVRSAILAINASNFTLNDIVNQLKENPDYTSGSNPKSARASITSTMKSLADRHGELVQVQRGKGPHPAVYRKATERAGGSAQ